MNLLMNIVFGTVGGVLSALITRYWILSLEKRRGMNAAGKKERTVYLGIIFLLGFAIGFFSGSWSSLLISAAFLAMCATAAAMDLRFRIIPNETVLANLLLKLLSGLAELAGLPVPVPFAIGQSLLGLLACFLIFTLPGFFGKNVGAGDVKLASAFGFFLGLRMAMIGIVLMGLAVIAYTLMQKRLPLLAVLKQTVPMAPFIAAGMFLVLVCTQFSVNLPV